MKIHQSGVKQFKINYQKSRLQWEGSAQEIVSKMFSTADWEEIPPNFDPDGGIILPEGITAPILFKFVPLLTDFVIVDIQHSYSSNNEAFIKELELYSDCKHKFG